MSHSFSRNLPMNRNGSGTSWMPDSTPVYAYMVMTPRWSFMFHGSIFLRYNWQDVGKVSERGDQQLDAPNWLMAMAQRRIAKRGLLNINVMMSLDPFTVGGGGYPLLFQTGETWKDKPLVDRQHPHDLFSELSVGYTHMISMDMDVYGYFGFPGEPALGPPVFMHRVSAMSLPSAPLGHHWQDATHIIFGVATAGLRYKNAKLETSWFTGREPGENRYNFDRPRFDSYSARLSWNPSPAFALQASTAYLQSPEAHEPLRNIVRSTASLLHSKALGWRRLIVSSVVWGLNDDGERLDHSFLLESQLQLNKFFLYGRLEYVQKSAHELQLENGYVYERSFSIHAFTLGANYAVFNRWHTFIVPGAQLTLFDPDKRLFPLYGKNPVSAEFYLRLTPARL